MAFFDKINDFAKTATEKTNNAIEITKLSAKAESEQRSINAIVQKIGEYYVAKIDAGEILEEEVMLMFEGIAAGRKNIAEMRAEIENLKAPKTAETAFAEEPASDKKFCPACGKELSAEAKFCLNCGAQQP
ncbi:MAG: zinc-ribbon domain-containing protein [Ruminococcaceae bacterium]|nr:zinc-ribbon domain-containing protein [Oscillospiraceae bacterium]